MILDVLAHEPDEKRPRNLILEFGARDAAHVHQTAIGPTVDLLPEIAQGVAEAVRGPVGHFDAEQQQVGRCPFEEILVMALQEEAAAAEMLPFRRAELDDVLSVGDRGLSHERNRVESATCLGDLEAIVRIQRGVVAERFREIPRADVPPTAQRRVAVEMKLLVLNAPAVNEVLILPDAVDDDVAREALEQGPRFPIGRVARIDERMHDAGAADESARGTEVVRNAGKHAAQPPDAMANRELREPERRGRGHATGARPAGAELQVESVDVLEHQPAVYLGDAIVVAALDPVGVRHADARSMSQAALRADDVEDRIIGAAR